MKRRLIDVLHDHGIDEVDARVIVELFEAADARLAAQPVDRSWVEIALREERAIDAMRARFAP